MAPGNSVLSACTVALMPIAASAPRTTPQGNHRNCGFTLASSAAPESGCGRGKVQYRLGSDNGLAAGFCAHSRKWPEGIVCQDIDSLDWYAQSADDSSRLRTIGAVAPVLAYPMICLEVIHLFPENQRPQVLAYELDRIQRIVESWPVS